MSLPIGVGEIRQLGSLEELASGESPIHRRHPAAKILAALALLLAVLSFGRYEVAALTPYLFYPFVLSALGGVPHAAVLRRFAPALPFCLLAGLGNAFFDRETALWVAGVPVSRGALSLFAILLRAYLCVAAILILVATTPFVQLTAQLRRMRVPGALVTLFEMTYRYIGTLLGEASSMYAAYMLRTPARAGLRMRHAGSFIGQLLLRSADRAERVRGAMLCRGYAAEEPGRMARDARALDAADWAYLALVGGACLALRVTDLPGLLGGLAARWP